MTTSILLKERFLALRPTAEKAVAKPEKGEKSAEPAQTLHPEDTGRGINKLLPLVQDDPLYLCDDGLSYIYRDSRLLLLDSKNRELCEDLRLDGYERDGKTPSRETVTTVIEHLSAKARRVGTHVELFNRVGENEGRIYYDMADGTAVEVSPGSWKIKIAPVVFRQLRHQKPQVKPIVKGGNPWRFLEFFELPEDQRLLFIVTLITSFIPRISHPAMHVSGSQGSGKSVLTSLFKSIIDPSNVLLSVMPRKPEDLDLLFFRYKVIVLDNLSGLNADTCDRLCSLISGGTIEKRTMYSDLETTILKANPIILYNSIGSLHSRADLVERSVVIETQRIPDEKRLEDTELLAKFNAALPEILGGIFDVLAQAMRIYPYTTLSSLPRMAGFARWGYTIAEVLGGKGAQFLSDYAGNSNIQTGELLERDTFFAAIAEAMDEPGRKTLSGSFNEVLLALMEVAAPGEAKNGYMVLQKDRTFPVARGFRKHLERIRIPLESMGISFKIDSRRTSQAKAFVTLTKNGGNEAPSGKDDQF